MKNPYEHHSSSSGRRSPAGASDALGFWERMHPGIRSALIFCLILLGAALLHGLTGSISAFVCYPIQVLLYLANGALAGYFAVNSGYSAEDLPRVGAVAGLVAWILPGLFYLIFAAILGLVTVGVGFLGIATWILCGPVDLLIQAACGALGAWAFGRFGGAAN